MRTKFNNIKKFVNLSKPEIYRLEIFTRIEYWSPKNRPADSVSNGHPIECMEQVHFGMVILLLAVCFHLGKCNYDNKLTFVFVVEFAPIYAIYFYFGFH